MDVRRARAEDIPEVVRLKRQLIETGWPIDVEFEEGWAERCAAIARRLLADEDYAAFVVDGPDGTLVGMVSIAIEQHLPGPRGPGRVAHLSDMSVDPSSRRRGLGGLLLAAALEWARDKGATRAELYATESGLGIYRAAGFAEGGPFLHMGRSLTDW